jgi:hypothetical protein
LVISISATNAWVTPFPSIWIGVQAADFRKLSWATWATEAAKIEVEKSRLTD